MNFSLGNKNTGQRLAQNNCERHYPPTLIAIFNEIRNYQLQFSRFGHKNEIQKIPQLLDDVHLLLKGLTAIAEEAQFKSRIVVCREEGSRLTEDGILIFNWRRFLEKLWGGEIIK